MRSSRTMVIGLLCVASGASNAARAGSDAPNANTALRQYTKRLRRYAAPSHEDRSIKCLPNRSLFPRVAVRSTQFSSSPHAGHHPTEENGYSRLPFELAVMPRESEAREFELPESPPSGAVTFLFTDIEGSTQRWDLHRDAMRAAVERHDEILRRDIEAHRGHIFKTIGDAFCAAFGEAADAV